MQYLFLAHGLPGCGKSTFFKNLKPEYHSSIISADEIRQIFNSNKLTPTGKYQIDGSEDKKVWDLSLKS